MQVQPYIYFEGRCEEAIEFYKKALGASVNMIMRFKDCPEPAPSGQFPPQMLDKIMHASLRIGDSTVLVSDGRCQSAANFAGFTLPILVSTEPEAQKIFTALSEGGKVGMPLAKTFFSPAFGMVHDKFGVPWMVLVQG
jgi:PhnB protein